MELWTYRRYQKPRLCVDAIDTEPYGKTLTLRAGSQDYRLAFDDAEAVHETAQTLTSLLDGDAELWTTIRQSDPDSAWSALATFLDTHSLIRETEDVSGEHLRAQETRIRDYVEDTVAAVIGDVPEDRRGALAKHAKQLCEALQPGGRRHQADPFDAAAQPNFFLGLLAVEFEYLHRSSPLTVNAAALLLSRFAGDGTMGLPSTRDELLETSGLYDEHDLESHLWLIGQCLALSVSDDASRLPLPPLPTLSLSSGLEFMRQTELVTRDALRLWGPNPYVTALNQLESGSAPIVAGPYIEQYHVTRRFVEIVCPLLSKRLASPLRAMMFRYFSEEVGHEALESTTCEALGVSERALLQALPLPLHFAFVDTLTVVAETDPIASFASIMVIEGVFGEPPRLSLRLAAVGRTNPAFPEAAQEHEDLNESLNHNSIARDAFEHISAVSAARQVRALQRVLFLLELNHRAWSGITEFYGQQKVLSLQGRLGQPLDPRA